MITEWLMSVGGGFGEWLLGIIPPIPLIEGWVGGAAALGGFVGSLGVWVNWVGVGLLVLQVMTLYFIGFAARLVRAIIGHIPQVGGNG